MNQENQMQANPQLVINYLTQEVASLTQENAMLKAIIQEQNNQDNQVPSQNE
ncbi:hypothetical protein N7L96_06615 [Mammaliicoccus sciuri]|uniref:hypothetical protein n=1 Tax=Mammaliicoccus sciuri TaxID=1296 RepID=UPI001FB2F4B1|nr:hypothetical protein [Mammaliicoccus sciuri]MCJ1785179.1 hypothetical protein [Mammaliicoccus sciuri]MDC5694278.1 hypothetical protein [Mammaliicoccus sciuri]